MTTDNNLRNRISAIDSLRGMIMLLMLVDHVRETIYLHKQVADPMLVEQTDPALFFTRFSAHFCAPIFVFLAGLSAWLYAHPAHLNGGQRDATGFLVKRGAFLILLEFTIINFAWSGHFPPNIWYLQVIWVIGLAMISLGLLHKLPLPVLFSIGLLIVAGHNSTSDIKLSPEHPAYTIWTVMFQRGFLLEPFNMIKISYPLLPWIGIILIGYCCGPLYQQKIQSKQRQTYLLTIGCGALAILLLLRSFNIYGENQAWQQHQDIVMTVMSYLNFQKYPPSLLFSLLTIGSGLICLAWLERRQSRFTEFWADIGAAPMFYYIVHLYLLLILQTILVKVFGANHGARFGVEHVWQVWFYAALLVPVLYYPCRQFARYKRQSKQAWIRYL
ncbi:DUF1624 domain-containing protein [Undibacterium macrobrachii]|uniref:Membrane protein n=1 Tax=Undibacterium macrobrachii TaxID=1119058 RepID=A0ABQ2XI22_9BURK|nr:heparan-alpha-glucosaminide N-acetyltransferase domain-containing protein [Undibacterium macrobrachii]GGX17169.1 membrane protein [Undibacterium macrobrachii]